MELVGTVIETDREDHRRFRVRFQCTNKEEFEFFMSPAIKPLPVDEVVRVWTQPIRNEDGTATEGSALIHWENL